MATKKAKKKSNDPVVSKMIALSAGGIAAELAVD